QRGGAGLQRARYGFYLSEVPLVAVVVVAVEAVTLVRRVAWRLLEVARGGSVGEETDVQRGLVVWEAAPAGDGGAMLARRDTNLEALAGRDGDGQPVAAAFQVLLVDGLEVIGNPGVARAGHEHGGRGLELRDDPRLTGDAAVVVGTSLEHDLAAPTQVLEVGGLGPAAGGVGAQGDALLEKQAQPGGRLLDRQRHLLPQHDRRWRPAGSGGS